MLSNLSSFQLLDDNKELLATLLERTGITCVRYI